jgi:hypothetical protein
MANITIYDEHRDVLDSLITSGKVASVAGATRTGPFKEMRDAYVYAVSIALALNKPTPMDRMPISKKGHQPIPSHVFLGGIGAVEVAIAVALVEEIDHSTIEQSLAHQLDLISEQRLGDRI